MHDVGFTERLRQPWRKARQPTIELLKATAYDAKAAAKETFGYDATGDRAEAIKHRATGTAKEVGHDAKSTGYQANCKLEEAVAK